MRRLLNETSRILKRNADKLWALGASLGVVATTYVTIKNTEKAIRHVDDVDRYGEMTKLEKVTESLPYYISTFVTGGFTIYSIFKTNKTGRFTSAALTSAYVSLQNRFKENAPVAVVESNLSEDDPITLYKDEFTGVCFTAKAKDILKMELELNKAYVHNGYANLLDYYAYLPIDAPDYSDKLGWCPEGIDDVWIRIAYPMVEEPDGENYRVIRFLKDPVMDYYD